ncbi:probable 2-oxoglutarate-dependent dioxygenase AOP1 [Cucurbita maxima]|uniref:Probable 2-oxoglutarate-dependent dioxygenase AOP1 n=1 Tax=Cucurbita maxima TaxID=3661 RepID=A0A6J1J6J6_CUCMA|nr:probable 2-oxoglutarate-dependent dioxygenase AOP1 [Cucurbita maxima]
MDSEPSLKLPHIDFSNLEAGSPKWELAKALVKEALQEFGCFEASFDKVADEVRKGLFEALEELFDLPLQTKLRNVSKKPFHGYVGQYPMAPLFESMGVDDSTIPEKVQSFANIFWPQGNPTFSKVIESYSQQLSELDKMVRRMVVESLGVEKYMEEHLDSTNYLLRVMKYKGPESNDTQLGLHSHTDKNIVTILYQNHVEGLQVQTKDGKWISFQPSPNSFVVMIGDSFHAWTNGRLYSPYHRVVMSGEKARYSAGLFSIPKAGYMIKAPKELVDEEHPLLFNPFDHVEFLQFYYTEAGQRAQSALKTYCGA